MALGQIYLLQLIVWLLLWMWNDYLAVLLTISIGAMVFAVLLIALISEWIERSKVPRRYFYIMSVSLAAIISSGLLFQLIKWLGFHF